jgi:WD40 repeat protein
MSMSRTSKVLLLIAGLALLSFRASLADERPKPRDVKNAPTDHYGDPLPPGAIARLGTVRLRHRQAINTVVFSADGKTVFSADAGWAHDGEFPICAWQVASGRKLREFGPKWPPPRILFGRIGGMLGAGADPAPSSHSLALSPDGRVLASAHGYEAYFWEARSGKQLQHFRKEAESDLCSIAFSPDGKTLACAADGMEIWDVKRPRCTHRFGKERRFLSVTFSPDGKLIATTDRDCEEVRVWDAGSGKELRKLETSAEAAVAFSPDGKTLAVGEEDGMLRLWEVATGKRLQEFKGVYSPVRAVVFSHKDKLLAWGNAHGTLRVHDLANGQELWRADAFPGAGWGVNALAFSPDGKLLASGGNRLVKLWHVANGKRLHPYEGHEGEVTSVAFTPDGKTLVSAGREGATILWDMTAVKKRSSLNSLDRRAQALSADGKTLAAAGRKAIILRDMASGKEHPLPLRIAFGVQSIAFSQDGKFLASAGPRQSVRIWDVASGTELRKIKHQSAAVAFSPGGKVLAATGEEGGVTLWETATGKWIRKCGYDRTVAAVAFSPDGRIVAGGENGGAIVLWDADTGRELHRLDGGTGTTLSMAFSSDGRMLASGSVDKVAHLWEVATGQEIGRFIGHDDEVTTVAFAPDGKRLATGSRDHTILVWDVTGRSGASDAPAAPLLDKQLRAYWDQLATGDAAVAYRRIWRLASAPRQTVPFFKERLRPVAPVAAETTTRLIDDLDSQSFQTRERAMAELEKLAELSEPALREVVKASKSAEVRARAKRLLANLSPSRPAPPRLQQLRALAALEYSGAREARELLQTLAKGAPEAWLTREAKASLARLTKRPAS